MFQPEFLVFITIVLLAFLLGLTVYNCNNVIQPIVILLGVTFISEVVSIFIAKYYRNNSPVYHVFNILQISFLGCFFYRAFRSKMLKRIILITSIGMVLFSIFVTLLFQNIYVFPSIFLNVETFILIIWSVLLFIEILDSPSERNIFKDPVFIITIGILWFNLFSFIFFLLHNYLVKNDISVRSITLLHFFSNYIYYLLILVALIVIRFSSSYERKN